MNDTTPTKVCRICSKELPATTEHFYRKSNGRYGLYSVCKRCHLDRCLVRAKERRATDLEYCRKQSEAARRWQRNHPEYGKNPEAMARRAERMREYQRVNPQYGRIGNQRRKARVMTAEGFHTKEDVQRKYEAQQGRCWWCGKPVGEKYHADHLIPLAKGGSNGPENIVVACQPCNSRKHAKMPLEFIGRLL
jgi:5-methylcytosine-specific restriction endonuclease McrA